MDITLMAVSSLEKHFLTDSLSDFNEVKTLSALGGERVSFQVLAYADNSDGQKYGELLTKRISEKTGVESKFARFAHVVRGGQPTLRDRYTATAMGVHAVELLLQGKSNVVMCELSGKIVDVDINYALIADRTYKNKLKDGDLDAFTAEQIASMQALAAQRKAELAELYKMVEETSK